VRHLERARIVVALVAIAVTAGFAASAVSARAWPAFALAVVSGLVVGLALDAALAAASRVRGRELAATVGQSAIVWVFALGGVATAVFLWTDPEGLIRVAPSAALIPFAVVALCCAGFLGRVQAAVSWLLAGTVMAAAMYWGVFVYLFSMHDQASVSAWAVPVLIVVALLLAYGSTGALALYVRRVGAGRAAGSPSWSRLGLAAGAVGVAVLLAIGASSLTVVFTTPASGSETSSGALASYLARDLATSFDPTELEAAGPAVVEKVVALAQAGSIDLTLVDTRDGSIPLAVRGTDPGSTGTLRFAPATLPADESAFLSRRAMQDFGGDTSPRVDVAGPVEMALVDGRTTNGTVVVAVTDPAPGWMTPSPPQTGATILQLTDMLVPWLLALVLLPVALALLALERGDRSRAELLLARERARLSRDAHDRVYNRLTALASRLETEAGGPGSPEAPAGEIRGAVRDLQRILGDVDVRMAVARDRGISLFDDVVADQARRWGIDVELSGREALAGIDPKLAWELQCVVEEALSNAGRHGHATHVSVAVSRSASALTIVVADDGGGIGAPPEADGLPAGARGLRGMSERLAAAGGTLTVGSGEAGTTVTAEVPL
jgi:signal transduction histidine kinase